MCPGVNVESLILALGTRDHDQRLNFSIFKEKMSLANWSASDADLRGVFDKFDVDGSGELDAPEVEALIGTLEKSCAEGSTRDGSASGE